MVMAVLTSYPPPPPFFHSTTQNMSTARCGTPMGWWVNLCLSHAWAGRAARKGTRTTATSWSSSTSQRPTARSMWSWMQREWTRAHWHASSSSTTSRTGSTARSLRRCSLREDTSSKPDSSDHNTVTLHLTCAHTQSVVPKHAVTTHNTYFLLFFVAYRYWKMFYPTAVSVHRSEKKFFYSYINRNQPLCDRQNGFCPQT